MEDGKEYCYDDLSDSSKTNAILQMGDFLQKRLHLWKQTGRAHFIDKDLVETMIRKLDTVFKEDGSIWYRSKKYEEVTDDLLKKLLN